MLVPGETNIAYICSRYYRAPELMFGATEYSVAVDVWSVGTILMELLLGHLPYQGQVCGTIDSLSAPDVPEPHRVRCSSPLNSAPSHVLVCRMHA